MTLATDWLLAGAAAFGTRLVRTRTRGGHWAPLLWGLAFLVGAGAALAGGAFHGFAATLPAQVRAMLWTIALTGSGVAASLLLAGTVLATLGGRWRRALVVGAAAQLVGCLALASRGPEVRHVVWNGTLTIVVILALAVAGARQEPQAARLAPPRLGFVGGQPAGREDQRFARPVQPQRRLPRPPDRGAVAVLPDRPRPARPRRPDRRTARDAASGGGRHSRRRRLERVTRWTRSGLSK